MTIQCILIPTDFSDLCADAVEAGILLAKRFEARIELAHAYGAPAATLSPYGTVFPMDLLDGVKSAARAKLDEEAERIRGLGLDVTTRLSKRTPQETLPWLAGEVGADLVVMGTRGHSGLKQMVLGSVAQQLIREAPCPVMSVPAKATLADPIERILVPSDFSTAEGPTLEIARELAGSGEKAAEIVLIHAVYVPPELESELADGDTPISHAVTDPARARIDQLVADLIAQGHRASGRLLMGRPEEAVIREVDDSGADLVVMGTHGRSGISHLLVGSVAERVVRGASCATVTVRPS